MKIDFILEQIDIACSRIAPVWPLENSVAVNPFQGFLNQGIDQTAFDLKKRGEISVLQPISFYEEKIHKGEITNEDIKLALQQSVDLQEKDFQAFMSHYRDKEEKAEVKIFSQVFKTHHEHNFLELMKEDISRWMAFEVEALHINKDDDYSLYNSWRKQVGHDKFLEKKGVSGFRQNAVTLSKDPVKTIITGIHEFKLVDQQIEEYLHSALLKLNGWASYCAGYDWYQKLNKKQATTFLRDFLAIMIGWELILYSTFKIEGKYEWEYYRLNLRPKLQNSALKNTIKVQSILQDAYDFSLQRTLIQSFKSREKVQQAQEEKLAQAIFCIDVRSEIYRRNLETISNKVETFGYAGFFGVPVDYQPANRNKSKEQCPVLIAPAIKAFEKRESKQKTISVIRNQVQETLKGLKESSVGPFAYVSGLGLYDVYKLVANTLKIKRPIKDPKQLEVGGLINGESSLDISHIPLQTQIQLSLGFLKGAGITNSFAKFILITAHGSHSANNPHAASLECGACGGNSGEVNALLAQAILNNKDVRLGLQKEDIFIPDNCIFLAALHNTTTNELSILNSKEEITTSEEYIELNNILKQANHLAREERTNQFNEGSLNESEILKKGIDWSQVRPEWGLVGCHSFIIADREKSKGIKLDGKSFLHSYKHQNDPGYKILESIMTAPMVVTSWINLQYFASTNDPKVYGAGDKTLHNVTAHIGVTEGLGGDLRIGLPIQSIHDGNQFQHHPYRLQVVIDAPKEAINDILKKHKMLADLVNNKWIMLLQLSDQGTIEARYTGNFEWDSVSKEHQSRKTTQINQYL